MVFQEKNKIKILIFLFLIAALVWIDVFAEAKQSQTLKVEFFDVGQGDSIFVETGDKKQILIDGGPDLSVLEKIGRAIPFYDRYIDVIVLTHPEQDHLNGLIEIIKRYNVGAIITSGIVRNTNQYREWIKIIEQKNIPLYIAQRGGIIDFGNGIYLNILHPFENMDGKELSDSNNYSIVSKLVYKNFDALFTGDIEKSVEKKLIQSGINLKSDILKIAHHGSKTSTSEEFLKAVDAIVAVIQMGKDNQYGHPHQEVLERLKNLRVLQIGEHGDTEIVTDGQFLSIFSRGSSAP
ncbi:MBL fold metallo-hydrolase [Patescibacteria group bacterium]|nr:MBL fold metallo-hydrolase [Patescibacteria group bacterium]MBU4458721.1 MBL fold metallo-hydrolase [Patescibacteria group bacterium]MCG2696078.1 MBL fold metallo-hydrolase [Candidatus Portnoybacteria bacterium]